MEVTKQIERSVEREVTKQIERSVERFLIHVPPDESAHARFKFTLDLRAIIAQIPGQDNNNREDWEWD